MNYNQFEISEITLSHEQAVQLRIDVINAIENYGIQNFESKNVLIDLNAEEDEPIKVSVILRTYTEYEENSAPFEPDIIERSVHGLKVQLWNKEGGEVSFKVKGERYCGSDNRYYTKTPIEIEEEIIKHFTI